MQQKRDLKKATGIDTHNIALNSNLPTLKAEVYKIDVDELNTTPVDLIKLSNAVNNGIAKKTVYDKLVAKINNIGTRRFALKNKYGRDKPNLEKKISYSDKKYVILVDLLKNRL